MEMPPKAWRVLATREVLDVPGRAHITVETVELPDGRIVDDYWQIKLSDFVVIYAEIPSGEILLLELYRHGPRRTGLEFVAGRLNDGEDPMAAAQRELLEETGYRSDRWEALGSYIVSGTQGLGTGHLFRAYDVEKVQEPFSGDLEEARVLLISPDRLRQAVRDNEFITLYQLAALGAAFCR
jgi:ADP-ribose pyrophosphatase